MSDEKTKHSKAPWTVCEPDDGELVIVSDSGGDDPEDMAVLDAGSSRIHPNARANAALMAAAPDLLSALLDLEATFRGESETAKYILSVVRPAIAKARGGK